MIRLHSNNVALFALTLFGFGLSGSAQSTHYVDATASGPGTGTPSDPFPTIQAAFDAQTTVSGDTVLVRPGTYEELVDFLGKSVHLMGEEGPEHTILDASVQFSLEQSVVKVRSGEGPGTELSGFTLLGGAGTQVVEPFFGNLQFVGGGLLVLGSEIVVRNCIFEKNEPDFGGGLYADGARVLLVDCTFVGNETILFGGAVHAHESDVTVRNTHFDRNRALAQAGGTISTFGGTLRVSDTSFVSDGISNGGCGGFVAMRAGTQAAFERADFQGAFVLDANGGAIAAEDSHLRLLQCRFEFNGSGDTVSNREGGAVYHDGGSFSADRCTFAGNNSGRGGAICLQDAVGEVTNCTFDTNRSVSGFNYVIAEGGAISSRSSALLIRDCSFLRNSVANLSPHRLRQTAQGGAVWCDDPRTEVLRCTFLQNEAVYRSPSDLLLERITPGATGGALHGPASIQHCTFLSNRAISELSRLNIWVEAGAVYGARLVQDSVFYGNEVLGTRPGFDLGPAVEATRIACCELDANLPLDLPAMGPKSTRQGCAEGARSELVGRTANLTHKQRR